MKKQGLMTLAVLGMCVGLCVVGCQKQPGRPNQAFALEQMNPDMQQFYNSLSSDAQQKFMQLDDQHRQAAMDMTKPSSQGGSSMDPNQAVNMQYNNQMQQRSGQMNGMQQNKGYSSSNPRGNGGY